MVYLTTGALLLLHTCWWGAGLALAVTPRPWQRFWPAFMPVCGFSLQSAVVWAGMMLNLPGANTYAGYTEVLPAALLIWQMRRVGLRSVMRSISRLAALWLLVGVVLVALVRPMSQGARQLTTLSIGSCDAADYAAGARLMQEFARRDRSGFLGLTEVVQLHSVDNFFDHFVRLNHFTPSALVAHHAAVTGWAPHELIGVLTAVFLAASLPLVFWLARATLGFGAQGALFVAAIYGLSPVTWYAVFHVAMSQLLAAQALTVVTIVGFAMWRTNGRRGRWAGLLIVAYGLIFGAYNFIIVIALVPAATFVLGSALWRRRGSDLLAWSVAMVGPAVVAGVVYAPRIAGLVERFLLFQQHDFGWPIRAVSPEGWLGLVGAPNFDPLPAPWRWLLAGAVLLAVTWTLRRTGSTTRRDWIAFALTGPVLLGYLFLQIRGAARGTNASYDAYKLLSVFYPGILAIACSWVGLWAGKRWERVTVAALGLLVLGGNAASVRAFTRSAAATTLVVDPSLLSVRHAEARPDIDSINVLMDDMWSRLWANAFLLRRPQYFAMYTYEGRRNTELKGNWNLTRGGLPVRPPPEEAKPSLMLLEEPYQLRRVDDDSLRAERGSGWFGLERSGRNGEQWRWTTAGAEVVVDNPSARSQCARLRLEARSLVPRELELWIGDRRIGSTSVGVRRSVVEFPATPIPPGQTRLRLDSPTPVTAPGPSDSRLLLAGVFKLEIALESSDLPLPGDYDSAIDSSSP